MNPRNASLASVFEVADCSIARMLAAVSGVSQIRRYIRTIRVPISGSSSSTPVIAATSTSGRG